MVTRAARAHLYRVRGARHPPPPPAAALGDWALGESTIVALAEQVPYRVLPLVTAAAGG